jgi:hypothetical protein
MGVNAFVDELSTKYEQLYVESAHMHRLLLTSLLSAVLPLTAQSAPALNVDPLAPLGFLLGTWTAGTVATGTAAAQVFGTYTFSRDLAGHALQRTGTVATCKGPQDFDSNHHDQLTIFPDPNGQASHGSSIFALYLDNEGHVIYYTVSTPDAHTAIFNSQGPPSAPKFRLTYHLEGDGPKGVMTGKFQFAPPGSDDYHSYLEWSGAKQ